MSLAELQRQSSRDSEHNERVTDMPITNQELGLFILVIEVAILGLIGLWLLHRDRAEVGSPSQPFVRAESELAVLHLLKGKIWLEQVADTDHVSAGQWIQLRKLSDQWAETMWAQRIQEDGR
jgi:hypothetical protein